MNHWTSKSMRLLQDLEAQERKNGLALPIAACVGFILEALALIAKRWPAGVREGFESAQAFSQGTLSVTALKKKRRQCQEWVSRQYGPKGWEQREIFVMKVLLEAMDLQLDLQKERLSLIVRSCVGRLKFIDPSLENQLEALLQKHFGPYLNSSK